MRKTPPAGYVLALALLAGCGGSFLSDSIHVSNRAADLVNAGTQALLSDYCAAQMDAIGRGGIYRHDPTTDRDRCFEQGPRAGTPATPAEAAALAALRARWEPTIGKAQAVVSAQQALAALLRAAAPSEAILAKLGDLAGAYADLRTAAQSSGLPVPPALSLQ